MLKTVVNVTFNLQKFSDEILTVGSGRYAPFAEKSAVKNMIEIVVKKGC